MLVHSQDGIAQQVRNPPATEEIQESSFDPWVGKIPGGGKWQPTPVLVPEQSHGQRSLAGDSPWGRTESDTAEATEHAHTHK